MDDTATPERPRRKRRWLRRTGRVVLAALLVPVAAVLVLALPGVQRWVAHRFAALATERLGTEVRIERFRLVPFGSIALGGVFVRDLHGDTLFHVEDLRLERPVIHPRRRLVSVGRVELQGARFALHRAVGDAHSNLTELLALLQAEEDTVAAEPWSVRCLSFAIRGFHFSFHDDRAEPAPHGVDFKHVEVRHMALAGHHLWVSGDSVLAHLEGLALRERSGLTIEQLAGGAQVSPRGIVVDAMRLRTPRSNVSGDLRFTTGGFEDYDDFAERVALRLDLDSSRLDFADIAHFAPELRGLQLPIDIRGKVRGTVAELRARELAIGFGRGSYFRGKAELTGLPNVSNTFMLLDINELRTTHADLAGLPAPPFHTGARVAVPREVKALGDMSFSGNFTGFTNAFTAYGRFASALGTIRTDLSYHRDTLTKVFTLKGRAASDGFTLGPLLREPALGPIAANVRIEGSGRSLPGMNADLEGDFAFITVNGRRIHGVTADGRLERNLFKGRLNARDELLYLDFEGLADLRGRWPKVDFTANLQHADLGALGMAPVAGYNTLSVLVRAQGRLAPDSLSGIIELTDISWCDERGEHDLGDLRLTSGYRADEPLITLTSDFADAEVRGLFMPTRLMGALSSIAFSVFPALRNEVVYAQAPQDFRFTVRTKDTGRLLDLLVPGLALDSGGVFTGYLDSRTFDAGFSAELPGIRYKQVHATGIDLVADKTLDVLAFRVRSERQTWKDSIWFAGTHFTGKAYQDELELTTGWQDSRNGTNGTLGLLGEVHSLRSITLDLLPSRLQLGRGEWQNSATARIAIDGSTITVRGFEMTNAGQRIALDGTIADDPAAALAFDLHEVDLRNLAPFLDGPVPQGRLGGDGRVFNLYHTPYILSYLCLDDVRVKDKPVGDLRFAATWAEGQRSIGLSGTLQRGAIKALDFDGRLSLDTARTLDMRLTLDRFDLAFIDPYLPDGISDIQGLVTGVLTMGGTLGDPRVNGELDLKDAGLRIDYLNTLYTFSHKLLVRPDMFALDLVTVRDEEGNTARLNGAVFHDHLRDWNFNVAGTLDRLMVLNTTLKENELYHGRAFASGEIDVSGYLGNLEVTLDARTEPGTDIHFPIGGSTEVSAIGFVQFLHGRVEEEAREVDLSGISLDLRVEVTPDAQFELIFDPTVGDIMSGRGRGNMEMSVDRLGQFAMRGQVEVTEGEYLFTLRNVVNKRFLLMPGGRITWFGDPFDAQLDLHAMYKLRAPLYELIPPGERTEAYRKRVPVEVVMHLREKLMNPEIDFQVLLPTVDESVRTQVNSVMSTAQEMNRQVFALIVLNRFVPPPSYATTGTTAGGNVAGTTTSELLSNQVSNWLNRLSNEFDLGVNYRPGDNITSDELEVAVSTQLFNERLLVSTNVGVQYGAQAGTSQGANQFVGDFQLEYLLTDNGKLRLKAFSVSNDRNLNRADQAPTTQGAGLALREEFDTLGEFWRKATGLFRRRAAASAAP